MRAGRSALGAASAAAGTSAAAGSSADDIVSTQQMTTWIPENGWFNRRVAKSTNKSEKSDKSEAISSARGAIDEQRKNVGRHVELVRSGAERGTFCFWFVF